MADKLPLVILPGLNSAGVLFDGAKDVLWDREVLALDPPGIGKSPLPLPFTVGAYARQVIEMLDARGIVKFDLMGHSMGGFAAQEVARMVPQRLGRLILCSTGCGQPFTARDVAHLASVTRKSFWGYQQWVDQEPGAALAILFGENFIRQHADKFRAFLVQRAGYLPGKSVSMAQVTAGGLFSSTGWLDEVDVETLVIHGTADHLVTLATGRELARRLPRARLLELFGVGHFPMLEHDKFYGYVQAFLDGEEMGQAVAATQPGPLGRVMGWVKRRMR